MTEILNFSLTMYLAPSISILITLGELLLLIITILMAVAFLTLFERKILASIQKRQGPELTGLYGLIQPITDALKLILKELIIPMTASQKLFILAPIMTFFFAILGWSMIPFDYGTVIFDFELGSLYIFAMSACSVYFIIIGGWASNSRYAFLGALRAASQLIAYKISLALILANIALYTGTFNLTRIVLFQENCWCCVFMLPQFIIFIIIILAETNRSPFDLPEAEGELVAGYHVEYSSTGFALFFLAEYTNIIVMSALTTTLFFGGWFPPFPFNLFNFQFPGYIWFCFKTTLIITFLLIIRASFPRYRYDYLMIIGWKKLLPAATTSLVFSASMLYFHNSLPSLFIFFKPS